MGADSAEDSKQLRQTGSGVHPRYERAYALRFNGFEVWLYRTETVIGRSALADIIIASHMVSREHAKITLANSTTVLLEDLSSRTGVFVNEKRINGPTEIRSGDIIGIGNATLELVEPEITVIAPDDDDPMLTPSPACSSTADGKQRQGPLTRLEVFRVLQQVADKALALGQPREAERLLSGQLKAALRDAARGYAVGEIGRAAASSALKLAEATRDPAWLNYIIQLYHLLHQPLPLGLVEQLERLAQVIPGLDPAAIKRYVAELEDASPSLEYAERLALRRVENLID